MEIALVSHASVIVRTADTQIWTDPWLTGKVFNNSWTLLVPPAFDPALLDAIDYLWISHEHPDHFNIATLRLLPEAFKRRVIVLFQASNSDKMFAAFNKLGFPNTQALPHREIVPLRGQTRAYCYQVGQMDAALAVLTDDDTIVDINDAEADSRDCALMREDLGPVRVVLNQFSLAGYGGEEDRAVRLPAKARQIVENMLDNHRDLGAEVTIPIASFVYFSSFDNAYMNAYINSPRTVADAFAAAGLQLAVLGHGDRYTVGQPWDSGPALRRYDPIYAELPRLPLDPVPPARLADITIAITRLSARLNELYPHFFLRGWLRPVSIEIVDLAYTCELDLVHGHLRPTPGASADVSLYAQPLLFALQNPFGLQTLGVSARLVVRANHGNWRRHRILLSMYNAELYLRPKLLLTRRNLELARARLQGGIGQLRAQLTRMR